MYSNQNAMICAAGGRRGRREGGDSGTIAAVCAARVRCSHLVVQPVVSPQQIDVLVPQQHVVVAERLVRGIMSCHRGCRALEGDRVERELLDQRRLGTAGRS
jgi:hypothetical protein